MLQVIRRRLKSRPRNQQHMHHVADGTAQRTNLEHVTRTSTMTNIAKLAPALSTLSIVLKLLRGVVKLWWKSPTAIGRVVIVAPKPSPKRKGSSPVWTPSSKGKRSSPVWTPSPKRTSPVETPS